MVWTPALAPIIVQVKALGLKYVESQMRKGEWDEYMRLTVLECVLLVTACPDGKFAVGTKVAATNAGAVVTVPSPSRGWESFTQIEPIGVDTINLEGPKSQPQTRSSMLFQTWGEALSSSRG